MRWTLAPRLNAASRSSLSIVLTRSCREAGGSLPISVSSSDIAIRLTDTNDQSWPDAFLTVEIDGHIASVASAIGQVGSGSEYQRSLNLPTFTR